MPPSSEQAESRSRIGIVVLVLAIVCFIAARTHADPDLWGHVRFGQDILTGGIPTVDHYSYLTEDQPWINHELLPEVLFAVVFNAFGVPGLVGLKVGLILLTIGLAYRQLMRYGLHPLRAGIFIVVMLMLMSVGLWTIRPHLFTYLFFLLTLLLLEAAEKGNKTALWIAPGVFLVWANSHGGFLAGLGVVFIWTIVHLLLSAGDRKSVTAFAAACVAVTLVNPYGWKLLAFLGRTATVARPEITEWQPVAIASPEGVAYLGALALSFLALLGSKRPRRPALLVVSFVTALLPLQSLRHLPLFGLSFGVLLGEHLGDVWNRWSPIRSPRRLPPAIAFLGAITFVVMALPYFSCVRIDPSFVPFPARATAFMRDAKVEGNLATFFDWGEYLIWHLSPKVRVSIDGRRETVYSPKTYRRAMQFLSGAGPWDEILDDPRTDMALVGRDQPTYKLMRSKPGWILVYEDSLSALFTRQDSTRADALRTTVPPDLPADASGLCFP